MEREGGVQNFTKVADLRGRADGAPVNIQDEISNLQEQCLGGHNQELCFIETIDLFFILFHHTVPAVGSSNLQFSAIELPRQPRNTGKVSQKLTHCFVLLYMKSV